MMALSLRERFSNAEKIFLDCKDKVPENLSMKLYGLSKQAKEGDCRMPMPPSSNTVLRAKWDSWTAYAGMENEKAMLEYIALIDRLDVGGGGTKDIPSAGSEKANAIRRTSLKPGQVLMKQGILYKQRDVFKGWRPRNFVLIDNTLTYYVEGEDITPRGSLALSGCTCVPDTPTMAEGVEYFPFTITHPGSSRPYHLSAISKLEADDWIAKINLAGKTTEPQLSSKTTHTRRGTFTETSAKESKNVPTTSSSPSSPGTADRKQAPATSTVPFKSAASGLFAAADETEDKNSSGDSAATPTTGTSIVKADSTLKNIPEHLKDVLESKIAAMFDAISPGAPGWEIFMDKDGVKGLKRPGQGDLSAIRADVTMPFNILDVFQCVTSVDCLMIMDSMRRQQDKLKIFSNHSWAEYFRFKEMWPISARDFVNLTHWRLLGDGTIVIISFSTPFDDLKPTCNNMVRGDMSTAGYIMRPAKNNGGTEVHFLVESDPKGSLPASIVNQVSLAQPKSLVIAKQLMEKKKQSNSLLRSPTATVAYQDFVGVITANVGDTGVSSGSMTAGVGPASMAPNTATGSSASTTGSNIPASAGNKSVVSSIANSEAAAAVTNRIKDIRGHEYMLMVLLAPVVLYYTIGGFTRSVVFIAAFIFSFKYLVQQHMGSPLKKNSHSLGYTHVPVGRTLVRIPVDLGHMLKYLDSKRSESKLEITISHVTIKACAAVLTEMPTLNGHVMMGEFYASKNQGIDVSYALDLSDRESVLLKVSDVDVKPIDSVTNEIIQLSKKTRDETKRPAKSTLKSKLLDMLSPSISETVDKFLTDLGQLYGINLPALGIEAFPAGVCAVITSPSMEGDADVEVSVIPDASFEAYSPPIVVSIGSVRVLPALEGPSKLHGTPVLNYSISFDNRAASVVECRKFCSKLQKYLRNPSSLEAKTTAPVPEVPVRRKSIK